MARKKNFPKKIKNADDAEVTSNKSEQLNPAASNVAPFDASSASTSSSSDFVVNDGSSLGSLTSQSLSKPG